MKIWISGSIARDFIMDFPGRFRDYIDPTKIHALNISFGLKGLQQNLGGTAANIAYNLTLLRERPELVGAVGADGRDILRGCRKMGAGTSWVRISKALKTSAAYIMTDRDDNQITGFYKGATVERVLLPPAKPTDIAIIASSGSGENMAALARHYRLSRTPYIFDPGQAITALSTAQMKEIAKSAAVLLGNDYEIAFVSKKTGGPNGKPVVKTLGAKGSEILLGGKKIRIGIAKPRRVVDPTGAGDAYRAGFLKGLIMGYNSPRTFGLMRVQSLSKYLEALARDPKARGLKTCGQLGATVASFAVEEYGTQNHKFSWDTIKQRYQKNFREKLR